MANYVVSIEGTKTGTYTKVKTILGDAEQWDYHKPEFHFSGTAAVLAAVMTVDGVVIVSADEESEEDEEERETEETGELEVEASASDASPKKRMRAPKQEGVRLTSSSLTAVMLEKLSAARAAKAKEKEEDAPPQDPAPAVAPSEPTADSDLWLIEAGEKSVEVRSTQAPSARVFGQKLGAKRCEVRNAHGDVVETWIA